MGTYKVKKITNISRVQIPIIVETGEAVYLPPKSSIEDTKITNYTAIKDYVRVEGDLSEVRRSKKRRLNG